MYLPTTVTSFTPLLERKKIMPAPREPFGRYLKRRRADLNLTQQEVADRGGMSQTYISELEKSALTDNPRTPARKMVPKIAQGLNVPVAEVEEASGFQRGETSTKKIVLSSNSFVPPADMRPVILSTGEVFYLRPDEPDPESVIRALEAWLNGYRAGKEQRD